MTTVVRGNIYVYRCRWIDPPHDKIALCICDKRNWFLWFNSKAAFHGQGQLPITPLDHPAAIAKDCFLDLSSVKGSSQEEIAEAVEKNRGHISDDLKKKIIAMLEKPIPVLVEVHRTVIMESVKS